MTALHGFLGLPSDWDALPCTSGATKPNWMPLLASLPGSPGDAALPALGVALNAQAEGGVLLGYSMGGRIALHMLLAAGAERWNRAVIVSASPGLADPAARIARLEADGQWARRFRHESWDEVVAAWNAQAVFATDVATPLPRKEGQFDRDHLWLAMLRGSVARQADLRPQLASVAVPVLWLAGEHDAKYVALARECAGLNPRFEFRAIPGGGHRAPWTAPEAFCDAIAEFMR